MTSFMVNNTNFSIVQNDGTYILSIVDPDFEQCEDLRGYIDFMDEKEKDFLIDWKAKEILSSNVILMVSRLILHYQDTEVRN